LDQDKNILSLVKELDREEVAFYNLTIIAKNDRAGSCQRPSVLPDISSILEVTVEVLDVVDTPPTFPNPGSIISGGVKTSNGEIGSSTSIKLRADDPDLNDPLTYRINEDSIRPSDPSLESIQDPFLIDENNEIRITFQANEVMKGYFTFSVTVTDTGEPRTKPSTKSLLVDSILLYFVFV